MSARIILTLLVAAVFGLLTGCTTTTHVGTLPLPAGDDTASTSSFELEVLPDSYFDGSSAGGYDLSIKDFGEDIVVSVAVEDARDLKALYFNMQYDPEQYRPMTAQPTELLGERGDVISLTHLKTRGTVTFGQVLANYEWRPGFNGNGVVAQVMFREQATPVLPRVVSQVPDNDASASVLTYDETNATAELRWDYANRGDYNQNGLAEIADLTPLGAALGQIVAPAKFPRADRLSVIDGTADGAITVAELTPLGAALNIQSRIAGYNVYATNDDTEVPTDNTTESNPALRIAQVLIGDAQGDVTVRKFFTFDLATTPGGFFYWVRPYEVDTDEGTPSNVAGSGVVAPSLTLTSPPAVGDGSSGNPYEVQPAQTYTLILNDAGDGDVSTAAGTTYTSDDPQVTFSADPNKNEFTIGAGAGNFTIYGTYNGINSNVLNFEIAGGGGGALAISPLDKTAAPWSAVDDVDNPAKGSDSANAYILHESGGFNPDGDTDGIYDLAFPMKAEDDLVPPTDLDETILEWGSFPPFVALDINTAPKGEFHVNQFSDGYVFAQDGTLGDSNFVWVAVELDVN